MTIPRQLQAHRKTLLAMLVLLFLMGCVPDQDYTPVVKQFQRSADTLSQAFQTLLTNANLVEYEHYIDAQAFDHAPLSPSEIDSRAVITSEELKLRSDAIRALAQYTSALATLAQGKEEGQIVADATAASTSFSTLATDAQTAAAGRHLIPATADYAGPISSAASAAGIILGLIERHRTHEEIHQSIEKNDPALTALFNILGTESQAIYERQKSSQRAQGVLLFTDYNREIAQPAPDKDYLLQLSDRIKQFRRNQALVARADPTAAIAAFKKSHDALVAVILAPKDAKPRALAELVTSVKSFAAEVEPLADGVQSTSSKKD
ncbi:MAG TPA: hypothetical protein VMU57_02685 [Edaphobacter sp.]|uniref:hypothetical protein n=1 Tax=Edaphobacter sp. TaxID=1934404 RepID=UPI002C641646|nr:hypothetical protein [Edaphobacter sp.]HUZ93796.1 hypothetical protein [Edaphobacter sp.]